MRRSYSTFCGVEVSATYTYEVIRETPARLRDKSPTFNIDAEPRITGIELVLTIALQKSMI